MTATKYRCRVEIFFKKGKIITFDFGHFAVVIEFDSEHHLSAYFGDDYIKVFMGQIDEIIDRCSIEESVISKKDFEEIERVFREWKKKPNQVPSKKMWDLIKNCFLGHVINYGM